MLKWGRGNRFSLDKMLALYCGENRRVGEEAFIDRGDLPHIPPRSPPSRQVRGPVVLERSKIFTCIQCSIVVGFQKTYRLIDFRSA